MIMNLLVNVLLSLSYVDVARTIDGFIIIIITLRNDYCAIWHTEFERMNTLIRGPFDGTWAHLSHLTL